MSRPATDADLALVVALIIFLFIEINVALACGIRVIRADLRAIQPCTTVK